MNPDMSIWTGRDDTPTEGPNSLRWWQCVRPYTPDAEPGIVLIGFACDEGVRRNGGRIGANDGPRALRKALANMGWYSWTNPVYDVGDVKCDGTELETAQEKLSEVVADVVRKGHYPLVIGGGHETAWGTFLGISKARPELEIGIINIDCHLDIRGGAQANSGTPFRQMADWCAANNKKFHYLCIGVSGPSNTTALFQKAKELGAEYIDDSDFTAVNDVLGYYLPTFERKSILDFFRIRRRSKATTSLINTIYAMRPMQRIEDFRRKVDCVYLSLDLDVLPASVMPGVSAPAARGLPVNVLEKLIVEILQEPRDKHFAIAAEVVELNPTYDPDGRSARTAAYLTAEIVHKWTGPQWRMKKENV